MQLPPGRNPYCRVIGEASDRDLLALRIRAYLNQQSGAQGSEHARIRTASRQVFDVSV